MSAVAKRYASAFFQFCKKENKLKNVRADIRSLRLLIHQSSEFNVFISNPVIEVEHRKRIINELLKGKVEPQTHRFLLFLSVKDRLNTLDGICEEFEQLTLRELEILMATVRTSQGLSQGQKDSIVKYLEKKYGKSIELNLIVDETIIGGIQVQIGDNIYDYTISGQLERFKEKLVHV